LRALWPRDFSASRLPPRRHQYQAGGTASYKDFARLAAALGRPELTRDPRFGSFAARAENAAAATEIVRERFATDTTTNWLGKLRDADLLADRINGFDEWLADPHIAATGGAAALPQPGMGLFRAARTPGVPAEIDAAMPPAPGIGEHGREILVGLGLDETRIAGLAADRALLLPGGA